MSENQKNLPRESKRDEDHGVLVMSEQFSGPLPHPNILARYDEIVPGTADRIIKKFESQTEHRQRLEKIVVWTDSLKSIAGIIFAFVIAMTTILGGIFTVIKGYQFLGGSLSFAGLALLVGAFLLNKQATKE